MCTGKRQRRPRIERAALLTLLLIGTASHVAANTRYDWRLRFRTLRTPHFDIHAHQGEEALAERLAVITEGVRSRFAPLFGVPRGRVQVILVDQTDLSNGSATPFPYDAIEITAVPPPGETLIGNTTEWLELVFTHEYTHILHLDRTRGWIEGLRRLFGRLPIVFPNAFLPIWQIEGIATFEESHMTGEGRIPAGDFRAIVDIAAAHDRFEPMDRAAGGLDQWPSGNAPYAYGGYFHQYLADRFGAEKLTRLADATSGRAPYFGTGAFRHVFGESVGTLWKEFERTREREARSPSATDAAPTRLTRYGFTVTAPRLGDDGTLYYSIVNPNGFPALMRLSPDGRSDRVAWRAFGNTTTIRNGWIVLDQLERVRSTALLSDLYAVKVSGGPVHRLTRQARAGDPDLSPDGRRIACSIQMTDRRAIAIMDFDPPRVSAPRLLVSDEDSDYSRPRWSPDGRQLVAERRIRAAGFELVIIDAASGATRALVSHRDARLVTPSWSADGATVLFSADLGDRPFDVFAVDVASGSVSRVTNTAGGAQAAELSPDGRSLVYIGYTPDGYDLFQLPYDRAALTPDPDFRLPAQASSRSRRSAEREGGQAEESHSPLQSRGSRPQAQDKAYHPWRTLVPTYWTPVVRTDSDELLVGAGTAMTDVLGRHAYGVDAAWANRARPDWHAAYAYDRWAPTLFASYSDDTDSFRGGVARSREMTAGALLRFRHIRWTESMLGAFEIDRDTLRCDEPCTLPREQRRRSLRGGWIHDSRRAFGYSIGAEEGLQIETAAETTRAAFGSDADGGAAIADIRAFQRVTSDHVVVAGRIAFAGAWGDPRVRRQFAAGGPGPASAAFDFGRDAIGLLRGFAADDLVGSRAAVGNIDLRVPLARPQRGIGNWPLFFRTIHAAGFFDAGHAWNRTFRSADVRTSIGGELSLDLVLGHYLPVTLTAGAAWTRDPSRGLRGLRGSDETRSRASFFARIGRAF
jgi:Tol biopolymer transport system component